MEIKCVFFDVGGTLGDVDDKLELHPYPDTLQLLTATRATGVRVGVISNVPPSMTGAALAAMLARAGLAALFDPALIIASSDARASKPSAAIFEFAAHRAQLTIAACSYVGEDAKEVAGARAAGMSAQLRGRSMSGSNYVQMCQAFAKNVSFTEPSPVPSPDGSPFDAGKLQAVVKAQQALLPAPYRGAYVVPLLAALPDITAQLKQQADDEATQVGAERALEDARSISDTLVGAVRDWGEPVYRKPLMRFEAVVSNLYRSFLSNEQRASVSLPLVETIPPLVTFAQSPNAGPFTLPVSSVKSLIHASIGVVSLPGCYAQHPLLWSALAHETGGHDVLHADPGLLEELSAGVAKLGGLPHGIGSVWAYWMDETASDVYGLLNVGPSFAITLAALLSTLEAATGGNAPTGAMSTILPMQAGRLADEHPVGLLRLYVALGAIEVLHGLSVAKRQEWISRIEEVAGHAAAGATVISVVDVDRGEVIQKLPLQAMADAARKVGAYIATAKLDALGGHSIQDIETWDNTDEQAALSIAQAAASGNIVALGDDAQLLAGATMALFADATKYAAITRNLNAALDDSFKRDPLFGSPTPHSALALKRRGRDTTRTPGPPTFPIVWAVS